jgi:hypothetical protein
MPPSSGSLTKAVILEAPEEVNSLGLLAYPEKEIVSLNTSPRAGQYWNISSILYRFPSISEQLHTFSGPPSEASRATTLELSITLILNQVVVAEQIVNLPRLQSFSTKAEWEAFKSEHYPITGAIEPFGSTILYAGNGLEIEYSLKGKHNTGFGINNYIGAASGPGSFYITYDQNKI